MNYAEGAAFLAPVQKKPSSEPEPDTPPSYSDSATATLDAQMNDDDYVLEDLCYMDTHNRMVTILRAYSEELSALTEPEGAASRAEEIARITRIIGYLEYAQKIVPGNQNRNASTSKSEAIQAAFPELSAKAAAREAKRLYHIASTQPGSVRRAATTFRGAGVGGALAKMGGAEIVYRDEIAAGKLQAGAPLQYWNAQSLYLHGQPKAKHLDGKEVYQAIVGNRVDTEKTGGIYGHSITFVRYDTSDPKAILCTDYGGSLDSYDVSSNNPYIVGANISTGGGAEKSAEFVLQGTGFKADQGKDYIVKQAALHKLDANKLAQALIGGINASTHANLKAIQASVNHHGTPSAFDHTMARLIGLWQYALGAKVDGLFGHGSCTLLTGKRLNEASAIQLSAPTDVATPHGERAAG